MILEILIAIILGLIAGTITGLIPGIHINLIAAVIIAYAAFLLGLTNPLIIAIFIVTMSVTHTFLDFIPSIFLGAPSPDTALSILPAHRMLLEGHGYNAVKLSVIGSLLGLLAIMVLSPLFLVSIKKVYPLIQSNIAFILIVASGILILKDRLKMWALTIFLLAGVLGIIVFNIELENSLFPLFSGLFGTSTLLLSLKDKMRLPKQMFSKLKIKKKELGKALISGVSASSLVGFLPGLGSAQAAILASSIMRKFSKESFIILIGSINTIVMVVSFFALYLIEKARNGSVIAISNIISGFNFYDLLVFLAISLIVAGIATVLALKIAKMFIQILNKIDYTKICIIVIVLIASLVLLLTGLPGFLILVIATSLGLIPPLLGINRSHLMGTLILPIILFFLL